VNPQDRLVCVSFGIEDANGWGQLVSLYNFPGTYDANGPELDTIFPLNTVVVIREPYCKMALAAEHSHIRIDSPSDLVILEPGDPLLSNVRWTTGDRQLPVLGHSAAEWKVVADRHFKAGEYFAATVAYSYALRRSSQLYALRLNRSLAHLRLGNFAATLRDAEGVLENPKIPEDDRVKALYRSAQAEYRQGHYENAKSLYNKCLEISPDLKDVKSGVLNSDCRIKEQSTGNYDWASLFVESRKKSWKADVAEFVGPVEIATMDNRGGGRGIRATDNIKPGDLLVSPHVIYCCNYSKNEI
jgi:tetratricopeptide (TPR) repeat protein